MGSFLTKLHFFIIKLGPLNGSRESGVIFNSTLQNILATYYSNTDNTCASPSEVKHF